MRSVQGKELPTGSNAAVSFSKSFAGAAPGRASAAKEKPRPAFLPLVEKCTNFANSVKLGGVEGRAFRGSSSKEGLREALTVAGYTVRESMPGPSVTC